jgi:hypothetical protein
MRPSAEPGFAQLARLQAVRMLLWNQASADPIRGYVSGSAMSMMNCAGWRCGRQSGAADFGTILARTMKRAIEFGKRDRPYPQSCDRVRALGPPWS